VVVRVVATSNFVVLPQRKTPLRVYVLMA